MAVHVIDIVQPITTACQEVMQRKVLIGLDGRIHCIYKNPVGHVIYAYSDDDGVTWTKEDTMSGFGYSAANECLALDSDGIPHVVYWVSEVIPLHHIEYVNREGGSWSSPVVISIGWKIDRRYRSFQVGEEVEGSSSGATAIVNHAFYTAGGFGTLVPRKETISGTFIYNETVRGQDSGARARHRGEASDDCQGFPAIVISSGGVVHLVLSRGRRIFHLRKTAVWSYGDDVGMSSAAGYALSIDIDTSNHLHIVARDIYNKHLYTTGSWGGWTAESTISDGNDAGNFSVALDESRNVHVAFSQKGVGGSHSSVENIKYRRCPAGTLNWGAIEHITDDAQIRRDPTIVIDKNDVIRIIFLGKGYGNEPSNENVVARKKIGASWGSIEVLVDRFEAQHEAVGLHCLFPAIGASRPNYPDGYAFIWNSKAPGTGITRVEYWSEIVPDVPPAPGVPTDLLCEQTTNPTDVTDPQPEFSAIYHGP